MTHQRKNLRVFAWSMIELLVAMALMAILVALLLPAVGVWRASAWTTKSLSNGRVLAAAAVSYATEHSGHLPQTDYSSWPDPSGYKRWVDEIIPYVYGSVRTNSSGQPMVDGTFRCPGLGGYKKMGDRWNRWDWTEVDWINVNERYVNGVRIPISTLTCPLAKTPPLVSTDGNKNGTGGISEGSQPHFALYVPPSVWIYRGGAIVTFLDGHVETIKSPNSTNIFKD